MYKSESSFKSRSHAKQLKTNCNRNETTIFSLFSLYLFGMKVKGHLKEVKKRQYQHLKGLFSFTTPTAGGAVSDKRSVSEKQEGLDHNNFLEIKKRGVSNGVTPTGIL